MTPELKRAHDVRCTHSLDICNDCFAKAIKEAVEEALHKHQNCLDTTRDLGRENLLEAVATEREACAKVAETVIADGSTEESSAGEYIAQAIRGRK